jgi:hypothetical protein
MIINISQLFKSTSTVLQWVEILLRAKPANSRTPDRTDTDHLTSSSNTLVQSTFIVNITKFCRVNKCDYINLPVLGAFANLRKVTISVVMSVRLHGTTRLPLNRFLWNLIFEYFSQICRENSTFIKIWQTNATCARLRYLSQFFLEWETLQTKDVERIKTQNLYPVTFFPRKSCPYEIECKNKVQPNRPQMAI